MPNRHQAIIWTNADPVHRRIYAALGGDELKAFIQISLKFVTKVSIAKKTTLVKVMADAFTSKPMITLFSDAYMPYLASLC